MVLLQLAGMLGGMPRGGKLATHHDWIRSSIRNIHNIHMSILLSCHVGSACVPGGDDPAHGIGPCIPIPPACQERRQLSRNWAAAVAL